MPLASHSTATIAQSLSGIGFPANRDDLVEHARKNKADSEILKTLKEMPDEDYRSMADVFKGVGRAH
ncbi:MAG: DUF2795 domain-containing protein [Alphaproteobacteria bacterium]